MKYFRGLISAVLAIVICASVSPPSFALESECACGFSPVIYVGPLGCADIVRDAGKDSEQRLWKTDTPFLLKNFGKVSGTLLKGLSTGDYDSVADAVVEFVNLSFGDLALDSEGKSRENVTVPELNIPSSSEHGPEISFYFDYDFRLDPFIHAQRLNECIQQIKELTGHPKVQLKASSMGGVVLSAYLETYGYSDVETVICQCCPLWGTAVAGELFCGKFELNAESLRRYAQTAIPSLDGGDVAQSLLYTLTDVFRITGIWKLLVGMGNKLADRIIDRVFSDALIPIFGTMPGIWSFVPQEYYTEALDFMGIDRSSELFNRISHYRTAQTNIAGNLLEAREAGVKTYIFCGYNIQRTPLVTAWKNTSDGTVDTKYASLGATCADLGETLAETYIDSLSDKKYLSPDRMIDASTCALADCTWFNRDWLHCNGQPAIDEFYRRLLTSDEQLTVFSMEEYPQFLQNDKNAGTLTPVTGEYSYRDLFREHHSLLNLVRLIGSFIFKSRSVGLFNA
ncbi:MAG: hypothetical protein K6F64_03770 [Clostridia bacterium]|nr:hypothetical protein [Clostridia bacterium]